MAKRDYMFMYRLRHNLSVEDMAIKCKTTQRIIRKLEDCDQEITHPKIAKRVGKAYELTKEQTEGMMPEIHRKSSPNYNPDKYKHDDPVERRLPTFRRKV